MPILTLMTLRASRVKEEANYSTRWGGKKGKILGLDIFIAVQFDLKSVCVYNSLLF